MEEGISPTARNVGVFRRDNDTYGLIGDDSSVVTIEHSGREAVKFGQGQQFNPDSAVVEEDSGRN